MPFIPAPIAVGSLEFSAECKPKMERERERGSTKGKERLYNNHLTVIFYNLVYLVMMITSKKKIQNTSREALCLYSCVTVHGPFPVILIIVSTAVSMSVKD